MITARLSFKGIDHCVKNICKFHLALSWPITSLAYYGIRYEQFYRNWFPDILYINEDNKPNLSTMHNVHLWNRYMHNVQLWNRYMHNVHLWNRYIHNVHLWNRHMHNVHLWNWYMHNVHLWNWHMHNVHLWNWYMHNIHLWNRYIHFL